MSLELWKPRRHIRLHKVSVFRASMQMRLEPHVGTVAAAEHNYEPELLDLGVLLTGQLFDDLPNGSLHLIFQERSGTVSIVVDHTVLLAVQGIPASGSAEAKLSTIVTTTLDEVTLLDPSQSNHIEGLPMASPTVFALISLLQRI